jgi:poly-gamma-glutamate capsule biosynthesis protein CapA/YwtB (metallophosphatase superfamily)
MELSISFLGDISFNDDYINLYLNKKNPFHSIGNILSKKDYVIGNLECMAKGGFGENLAKKPRLTTTVETLNYLNVIPVNIVSLAHNHIYDHLEDGFIKTTNFLNNYNIGYLGASQNSEEVQKPIILNKNNINVGFLNYVTEDTNPNLPDNAEVHVNIFEIEEVVTNIKDLKKTVDHVVLLLHWGGRLEGGNYPDWEQPETAHKLIDAGADLIIGTHSHTLQPFEIYNEKHIFYSLGNFCFADIHSDGKVKEIEWGKSTESVIVNVNFSKVNYKINYTPINCKYLNVTLEEKVIKKWKHRQKIFKFIQRKKFLWQIYYLKHRKFDPVVFYFFGNDHNFFKQLLKLKLYKLVNYIKRA